jgi:hypothetical protein
MNCNEDYIWKNSASYAFSRTQEYKNRKKITPAILKDEITTGRVVGEMANAERILKAIIANPDWNREDIEAELHLLIQDLNNHLCEKLNLENKVDLEKVLSVHGYIK